MASLALSFMLTSREVVTSRPRNDGAALTRPEIVISGNSGRDFEFLSPGVLPKWVEPNLQSACHVLVLPRNWDQQDAAPVRAEVVTRAIETLSAFMSDNSAIAQWTPTQLSGVQLDWHENAIDLEISFEPGQNDGYAVFSDNSGAEWDGPVADHVQELRQLFRNRLVR